jgi:hypothetical protein
LLFEIDFWKKIRSRSRESISRGKASKLNATAEGVEEWLEGFSTHNYWYICKEINPL